MELNRRFGKKLIYFQIVYSIIIKFFISEFGFPYALNYVTDVITILLFLCVIKTYKKYAKYARFEYGVLILLIYFGYCILSSLFNSVSLFLFIWAFRNTFRFFAFFVGCFVCLDQEDEDKIWGYLLILQLVNIVLTFYQFAVKGYQNDFLGGIFGYGQGVNGGTNLFFCILLIIAINRYINKNSTIYELVFVIISTLLLAVLSEIKLFYIEFVIIVLVSLIVSRPSKSTVCIGICILVIFYFGAGFLENYYPDFYYMIISPDKMYEYSVTAYGNNQIIGRMTGIDQINQEFFSDKVPLKLFGLGFGNCESSSSIAVFNSEFSKLYGNWNYKFFSYSMIYLETGYIGLILYLLFFLSCAYHVIRNNKIVRNKENIAIVICTVAISMIATWYNYSMKIEYSYFVYAVLAFGIIEVRKGLLCKCEVK